MPRNSIPAISPRLVGSDLGIDLLWRHTRDPCRVRLLSSPVQRRAFESAGVEFIDENGGGPGVRLRKRQQKKD
jgi:hypothetical protein